MKIRSIKKNLTEVTHGGKSVLFSYETPVAALIGGVYYKTDKKWSNTTTRHINSWVYGDVQTRPQEFFDLSARG